MIRQSYRFNNFPPGLCSFLVALGQCAGAIMAILVVEKFGRRSLLIVSELCVTVSIVGLGAYFYAKENADINCLPEDVSTIKMYWVKIRASLFCHGNSDTLFNENNWKYRSRVQTLLLLRTQANYEIIKLTAWSIFTYIFFSGFVWTCGREIQPGRGSQLRLGSAHQSHCLCHHFPIGYEFV